MKEDWINVSSTTDKPYAFIHIHSFEFFNPLSCSRALTLYNEQRGEKKFYKHFLYGIY